MPDKLILVADDELEICRVLGEYLNELGYSVLLAENGEQAVELADEHEPDLVFLDIKMPRTTGLEALGRIRERHPRMKVIMITGVDDKMLAREALLLGASDFIPKPFSFSYMKRVLDSLV
ncbi:MAG: response regulator [Candidatus Delongbacteria bacterium]|nr:response regulator [Candidatus Delongbacteria bacterium]